MVELAQDSRLAQERAPLFLRAAAPQCLDGHRELTFTGQLQAAAAHLTKITYGFEGGLGGHKLINITVTVLEDILSHSSNKPKHQLKAHEGKKYIRLSHNKQKFGHYSLRIKILLTA